MQHKQENKLDGTRPHHELMTSSVTHCVCMAWCRQGLALLKPAVIYGDWVSHMNSTRTLLCFLPSMLIVLYQTRISEYKHSSQQIPPLLVMIPENMTAGEAKLYDNMQEKCILVLAFRKNGDKSINCLWIIMVIISALDISVSCLQITIHNNEAENWYFSLSSVVQCNEMYFFFLFFPLLEKREWFLHL